MSEPILHAEPSSRWDYYNLQCRYRHSHKLLGPRRHPQKASRQLLREQELLSSRSPYLLCAVSRTLNLNLPTFIPDVSDISVISLTLISGFDNPTGLVWGDKGRNEGATDRGEHRQAAGAAQTLICYLGAWHRLSGTVTFATGQRGRACDQPKAFYCCCVDARCHRQRPCGRAVPVQAAGTASRPVSKRSGSAVVWQVPGAPV
jgi:hypothetical protein